MNYNEMLNTPLCNAEEACVSLRNALCDLGMVFRCVDNYEEAERLLKARKALSKIEKMLWQYRHDNIEALKKDLEDAGII